MWTVVALGFRAQQNFVCWKSLGPSSTECLPRCPRHSLVLLHVLPQLIHTVTQLYLFSHGWIQGPNKFIRIPLMLCLLAQFFSVLASSSGRVSLRGSNISCWESQNHMFTTQSQWKERISVYNISSKSPRFDSHWVSLGIIPISEQVIVA